MKAGRYSDGAGLILVVRESGAKSWLQRITISGKRADLGLGGYPDVGLSDAREKAQENRKLVAEGKDPRQIKAEAQAALRAAELAAQESMAPMTWNDACEAFHRENKDGWRNAKHAAQVITTLQTYTPNIRDLPVADVEQHHISTALKPIWLTKQETAQRVFQRIGKVLLWAQANGHFNRSARDLIESVRHGLRSQDSKTKRVKHHTAMPYSEVAAFLEVLRGCDAMPATRLSLEFLILTAARSGEVRGATWAEIDLEARMWTVPEDRIKGGIEHRVPLTDRAVAILEEAAQYRRDDDLIFGGLKAGRPISENTYIKLMRDLGFHVTAHGFRSSFRQWAAECTSAPREVAERCLAHVTENAVERAYQRSDHLEARRALMVQWARYIDPEAHAKVIEIGAAAMA